MDIPSKYDPSNTEDKWYQFWLDQKIFRSTPDDREPYTIVIPPPNVTGVLHMGHMLNNTLQDVLIRRARMLGKNALWVPGTDHASIATEARIVAKLKNEGINKGDLSREEFLKHAWEWKEKHGGIILEQLKKLGASCDWERTRFTMDDTYYESVIDVFIDLYEKGLIYRGVRMVNWDPEAKTAVSDEEVMYREVQSKLYYLKYKIEGEDDFVTIATTRPETILGDTAVCINPNDERFKHLKGKKVLVPLINRSVPIIEDDYVDMEFGTGCLKITPAHDINDYEIGIRHNLESIDIFNDDGTLNEKAQIFIGKDRFEVRKLISKQLEEEGHLAKLEDYVNKVGYSERTEAVIEPKLSMQWFVKMKELSKPALDAVINDEVKLHPPKFKNTYRHWMENVKDWCISRQLWWGQRIPVYYINNTNEYVVAATDEKALQLAKEKTGNQNLAMENLAQDPDVLDTWFSSWLWPISVFDGLQDPDSEDINYYYPTSDLVTAPEILFFWVARMIIAGYEYRGKKPFNNVYLTGIVRDKLRRKMSKSLGNSPDPLELIKKYSADGVRVGMLLCSPAGNDLLFDENLTEQGRNFGNKIWNAFRLVHTWQVDENAQPHPAAKEAITWFEAKLNAAIKEVDDYYSAYRISDALMVIYRLFWDDYSSWYLEAIKPGFEQPIAGETYKKTLGFLDKLLKLLHPFMPFITEEIWHLIEERNEGESISTQKMPEADSFDEHIIKAFESIKEAVTTIRNIRQEKNLALKEALEAKIKLADKKQTLLFIEVLKKLGNLSAVSIVNERIDDAVSFRVKSDEFYLLLGDLVNTEEEIKKLEEELGYQKGFLTSVMKKLSNERFVQNAPEKVVAMERKKQADAETKIKMIEERLQALK
ncbi:MAG: valine--tRNA ligase [Bacteroidota bacterium]